MATVPVEITWVTGQIVTAAQLNANLRDAVNFLLAPPFAIMRNTANQSLANITFVSINFDTEDLDRDGGHSTSVNTSRYTAQTAGWYEASAVLQIAASATGRRLGHYNLTGVTVATGDSTVPAISTGGGNTGLVVVARTTFMNVGDYLEVQGFQDSGGALNCVAASYFQARYVSTT